MSVPWLFVFGALCAVGVVPVCGEFRAASQPRANFAVRQRKTFATVPFISQTVIYMEPSDFSYQGLKQQRDGGAYDNFLRSSIDNEQDKRNFNNEPGRDMLPFRSFEGAATDASPTVQTQIPNVAAGPVITAKPGWEMLYPLRWNSPHASELEVNVWIMNVPNGPVVVPIRKPTCSGEGHQDNVFSFTVPADFNNLGTTVPGFTGCKNKGDCVLQVYAHSVEPRTYAIGVPLVITGTVPTVNVTNAGGIELARQDVGLNLTALSREVCLSSADPSADILTAVPRAARHASDVFNHAYQNSDYSPYSGQQPEAISRNLQAAAIISMIPANRGELGQALLKQQQPDVAAFAANLRNKVAKLVRQYEGLVNRIITQIGDPALNNTAVEGENGDQRLATCFRCAEVGSTSATRLTLSTYVPSFQLPPIKVAFAKALIPASYSGLISDGGVVGIYAAALSDLSAEFALAANMSLLYQPALIKASLSTMSDATRFQKVNASGAVDNGIYAALQAQRALIASAQAVDQRINVGNVNTPLMEALHADVQLPSIGTPAAVPAPMSDVHGLNYDSTCDDDSKPTNNDTCSQPQPMFAAGPDGVLVLIQYNNTAASTGSDSGTNTSSTSSPSSGSGSGSSSSSSFSSSTDARVPSASTSSGSGSGSSSSAGAGVPSAAFSSARDWTGTAVGGWAAAAVVAVLAAAC